MTARCTCAGHLSYKELVKLLRDLFNEFGIVDQPKLATIESKFEEADTNRDNKISCAGEFKFNKLQERQIQEHEAARRGRPFEGRSRAG